MEVFLQNRTKLTIRQIRTYNAFLEKLHKSAISADLARSYRRAKIVRAKIGQTVLKGQMRTDGNIPG